MRPPPDTIGAVSTPPGRAPRGILRLSGPEAFRIALSLFRPGARPARFAALRGSLKGSGLPAILLLMRAPGSYTREDVAEIHAVSDAAVLPDLLAAALRAGARHASPGEFTRRALLNGRISLDEAEAVMKLISARSSAEARLAASQVSGGLSRRIRALCADLAAALALVEAGIDFSDQEAVQPSAGEIKEALVRVFDALKAMGGPADGAAPSAGEPVVLLAGPPNAGKSSIFNACAGECAAIVHESPGTTIDANKRRVSAAGAAFVLVDGPGLAPGSRGASRAAQEAFLGMAETADVLVYVVDGSAPLPAAGPCPSDSGAGRFFPGRPPHVAAVNKSDLPAAFPDSAVRAVFPSAEVVRTSAAAKGGVDGLLAAAARAITSGRAAAAGGTGTLNARQRAQARSAAASVLRALRCLESGAGEEIAALEIREGIDRLGGISGRAAGDAALDLIFERFCVGK